LRRTVRSGESKSRFGRFHFFPEKRQNQNSDPARTQIKSSSVFVPGRIFEFVFFREKSGIFDKFVR
jgi:hypothetical protein